MIASDGDASVTRDHYAALMGCVTATGRERLLVANESAYPFVAFEGVAIAGAVAAIAATTYDDRYDNGSAGVEIFDLATGVPRAGFGNGSVEAGYAPHVVSVVVNAHGFSAAVLESEFGFGQQEQLEVDDSAGASTIATIDAPSNATSTSSAVTDLTLTGDTLTWLQNGTPESHQLG